MNFSTTLTVETLRFRHWQNCHQRSFGPQGSQLCEYDIRCVAYYFDEHVCIQRQRNNQKQQTSLCKTL